MDYSDFIQIALSAGIFIFLVIRGLFKKPSKNSPEIQRKKNEQEANLKKFLETMKNNPEKKHEMPSSQTTRKINSAQHAVKEERNNQKKLSLLSKAPPFIQQTAFDSENAYQKKQKLYENDKPLVGSAYYSESYEVIRREKVFPVHQLLQSLKSPKDMVILKEILDKPLCMREFENRE